MSSWTATTTKIGGIWTRWSSIYKTSSNAGYCSGWAHSYSPEAGAALAFDLIEAIQSNLIARGSLERIQEGNIVQYRCRVGHAYSRESAIAAHAATEENTLWAAVVALEEGADLWDDVAGTMADGQGKELTEQANKKRSIGARVRALLKELETPHLP